MLKMNRFVPTLVVMLFFSCLGTNCKQKPAQTIRPERKNIQPYGSLIKVKKEFEEQYIILHNHAFPGVLDRIHKSNITNYSIFLLDGVLFSHFEYAGSDFEKDMAAMGDEVTKEWWKLTDPMQEPFENRKEGEWWASAELLYRMGTSKATYQSAQRLAFVGELKDGQLPALKRYLTEIEDSFVQLILSANIQNWTLYEKDGRVYFYYEYVGSEIRKDLTELENTTEYQVFANKIEPLFTSSARNNQQIWKYMKEVFHTD
jgi:L-rhamnose mutarotase